MTAMNWYAVESLLEVRKQEMERAARHAEDLHVARAGRRTRRLGRRH